MSHKPVVSGIPETGIPDYRKETFSSPMGRSSPWPEILSRYVDPRASFSVLEIGCGTGSALLELAGHFPKASLVGVDISPSNIARADEVRAASRFADRLTFTVADYMKFSTGPVDVICANSSLHLIPTPSEALFSKLADDVKAGGIIAFSIPTACRYNAILVAARKVARLVRNPVLDRMILAVGTYCHPEMSAALLRERVPYAYVIPERCISLELNKSLAGSFALDLAGEHAIPHASFAQLVHQLNVYRKRSRVRE